MRTLRIPAKSAVGATGIAVLGVFSAAGAAAAPSIQDFGTGEQLNDGALVTTYIVDNLQPSATAIPGFTPHGQLYQADVTARADSGTITPIVADFNARSADGQNYRVIDTVPTPDGINPSPLGQGAESSGKIYFDVVGPPPNSVVYNDGVEDVMIWANPTRPS